MKKRSNSQQNPKRTEPTKRSHESVTIGMDLGDKSSRYCVLGGEGKILREGETKTTKGGMMETFGALGRARIAIGWNSFSLGKSPASKCGTRSHRGQSKTREAHHRKQPKRRPIGCPDLGAPGPSGSAATAADSSPQRKGTRGTNDHPGACGSDRGANQSGEHGAGACQGLWEAIAAVRCRPDGDPEVRIPAARAAASA